MTTIVPAISGPKRPQDYVPLTERQGGLRKEMAETFKRPMNKEVAVAGEDYTMESGKVVIASITSCTNTSNPYVMIGAGLVARKAAALGLNRKPWVKTSLAPGSQVVSAYLEAAGLQEDLDKIGFNLVGYGCTTCIGNSGPLQKEISEAMPRAIWWRPRSCRATATSRAGSARMCAPTTSPRRRWWWPMRWRARWTSTSPPIRSRRRRTARTSTSRTSGRPRPRSRNWWRKTVTREAFIEKYADVFKGDEKWQGVEVTEAEVYDWPATSTYIQNPPYFRGMGAEPGTISNIEGAKVLAILGDMVTTDHISPAGSFKDTTPAGKYLVERQVPVREFNSYGSRRGNHEVMMRGTFANIRIKNEMLDGVEGGYTLGPDGQADLDLRRGHGLPGGRHAARRLRR
jgi:aconitate hydratase